MNYNDLLNTKSWSIRRKEILKRDKNQCMNCNSGQNLNVHHRQYHYIKKTGKKLNPWDYSSRYLITLCNTCHLLGHKKYKIPSYGI